MPDSTIAELLELNKRLLDCIGRGDWAVYQELCDPNLTAFEPEAMGQLVEGMMFHHFYFGLGGAKVPHHTTMCSPHVRVMGDTAIVAYIRLNQCLGDEGKPVTKGFSETRVWQRQEGQWKHVHFHRTALP